MAVTCASLNMISALGPPSTLQYDNGGEFSNAGDYVKHNMLNLDSAFIDGFILNHKVKS